MSASLDDLTSYMRPVVDELITRCFAVGIPVRPVCTLRDLTDEESAIITGHSWLSNPEHSKHLPQPPEMKAEAVDLGIIAYLGMPNWNPNGPNWNIIGKLGKDCGLIWGGDWTHLNGGRGDPSHFEWSPQLKAMAAGAQPPSQPSSGTVPPPVQSRSPFPGLSVSRPREKGIPQPQMLDD